MGQRLTDGYCDIQLLLMVDEHVSEMQMNVTSMLHAKHMGGHRAYVVFENITSITHEFSNVGDFLSLCSITLIPQENHSKMENTHTIMT